MQCPHCNTPLVVGARFCGVCGNTVSIPSVPRVEVQPAAFQAAHDDVTMVAPWPEIQPAQTPQTPQAVPLPPSAQPGPAFQQTQRAPLSQQEVPGTWQPVHPPQQPTQVAYPPQQPAQVVWSPTNQPQHATWPQQPAQGNWPPANQPQGAWNQPSAAYPPGKRQRKWPLRVALVLLILVVLLVGGWFLGARPYLNNLARTQINQVMSQAQSEISVLQNALPAGPSIVPLSETDLNSYINAHAGSQLQNIHLTITPTGLQFDFKVYGFGCTILAVPVAVNGALQVTQVQTQGLLGLVLSGDELTNILNPSLQSIGQQMHGRIVRVILQNHVMNIQLR